MAGAGGNKLHAEKFEQLIARRGRVVHWEEAVICSCWNVTSGQPAYECAACEGKGYVYEDPITEIAVVMSVTHNKEYEAMAGVFEVGDAVMSVGYRIPYVDPGTGVMDTTMKKATLSKLYYVGVNDRITLMDDTYKTSEILTKGVAMYARQADTLLNKYVTEVRKVRKYDPITGAKTDYEAGVHYNVVDNRIEWLGTSEEPNDGEQYSVVYSHRPTFTIFTNLPTPRYQDKQQMPRRVALRYLAGGVGG